MGGWMEEKAVLRIAYSNQQINKDNLNIRHDRQSSSYCIGYLKCIFLIWIIFEKTQKVKLAWDFSYPEAFISGRLVDVLMLYIR